MQSTDYLSSIAKISSIVEHHAKQLDSHDEKLEDLVKTDNQMKLDYALVSKTLETQKGSLDELLDRTKYLHFTPIYLAIIIVAIFGKDVLKELMPLLMKAIS